MKFQKIMIAFLLMTFCVFARAEGSQDVAPAPEARWADAAQEILMNALSLTGVKYKYGGTSPETGLDCSGFVRYVFQQAANLSLPRSARAISQVGQNVPQDQLQPGDLVFFNTLKSAFSHVGIYLGDGKFVHAPSSGGKVHVADMNDRYWSKRYNGARRMAVTGDFAVAQTEPSAPPPSMPIAEASSFPSVLSQITAHQ
ncbi:MAG: C40 family peptidase [Methylobacillus sp.]|jgi:cell wall-associated NlpC family hydrolase|nr:C40 family peptidase [Methylobacillus sp.]